MQCSNSRRIALKTAFAACLGISTIFMTTPSAVAAPVVKLRMASSLPADQNSAHYVWFERFQANLKASVNDAVEVTFFANGMLGKEADVVQQVRLGALDMMVSGTSIWATLVPEVGVLDLGYLFDNNDHAGRALDGKAGEALSGILLKKANIKTLGYGFSFGARNVYSKKPIKTQADLHGVKVRVLPAPNFIATLKAMGATAVPMPGGEVYSGLQMGVIEGVEHDAPSVLASKYYEVAKYCALTQHIYNPIVVAMNSASFERIPAQYKAAVLKAAAEATSYERMHAAGAESKAFDLLKKQGVTVTAVDRESFRKAVKPVWAEFSKQYPGVQPVMDAVEAARK
ncbi:MAG: C4-dicarboxylate transporter substrate-binding protein [Proteobacteria bacterium]|nr:C4-dicarboxylate transporter substrate-binding protein [Pseudomonadota bacterium]